MQHSEEVSVLVAQLATFQKRIRPLDKRGRARGKNGEFYSYAPIDDILRHIRLPLAKLGLFIQQTVTGDIGVTTTIFHPTGQWLSDTTIVQAGPRIEDKGAAVTLLRRYSLITILGLPTVEPDVKVQTPQDIIDANRLKLTPSNSVTLREVYESLGGKA